MKRLNDYKMRLVLVGVMAAIVFGGGSANADFTWMDKADMPTPRWSPTSAVVNGKIYVIGGGSSQPGTKLLSTVEEYNPTTDTWTRKADMPTARGWMSPSSAVVDGKIYAIGGDDGRPGGSSPIVEEYDPYTDTWIRKMDMPTSRWGLASCSFDGKIYVIGGTPPLMKSGV
jgi:N-acetylneuraminic acid mutarotase